MPSARSRLIGELTSLEASQCISANSILLWPLGATEQHGPHLPLDTDCVIAREVCRHLLEAHGERFDLWQLPEWPLGLSPEHAWAPGTLTLRTQSFAALLDDYARSLAASLPARNLVLVNGHGGNRGILQALIYELEQDHGFNAVVLHPLALAGDLYDGASEIHGGKDETSLMLALAHDSVRRDQIATLTQPPEKSVVHGAIAAFGTTWAWSSGDRRIADEGVTGDAAAASAEFGHSLMAAIVQRSGKVFEQLLDNAVAKSRA